MRTRIKVCGISRTEDAQFCAESGIDAIGLVFVKKSPRAVSIEKAQSIIKDLPVFVDVVALFMDSTPGLILDVLSNIKVDLIQFHGAETAEECEKWQCPYIKAIAMGGQNEFVHPKDQYPNAKGFILDAHQPGEQGGSGQQFDWHLFPKKGRQNLILAGGLRPDNVLEAILQTRPWAIDLSSGLEHSPGIKSHEKIQQLVKMVRQADEEILNETLSTT